MALTSMSCSVVPVCFVSKVEKISQDIRIVLEGCNVKCGSSSSLDALNECPLRGISVAYNTDTTGANLNHNGGIRRVINVGESSLDMLRLRQIFISENVHLNLTGKYGLAALHMCAELEDTQIAETFIALGADPNAVGEIGCSSLPQLPVVYHALKAFNSKFLHVLLTSGANLQEKVQLQESGLGMVNAIPHVYRPYLYLLDDLDPHSFLLLHILRSITNPDRYTRNDTKSQSTSFCGAIKCFYVLNEFGVKISYGQVDICGNLLRDIEFIAGELTEFQTSLLKNYCELVLERGKSPLTLQCLSKSAFSLQSETENLEMVRPFLPLVVFNQLCHLNCFCSFLANTDCCLSFVPPATPKC